MIDVIAMTEQKEIEEWIRQIGRGDIDRQREASRSLSDAGEAAVAPVIEALAASADPDERWYLAGALSRMGWPALDPLIAAIRARRDPGFRRYASAALAGIGEDAVAPLIDLLEVEDDAELRGFVAQALARIGEPALEPLREAVEAGGTRGVVAGLVLWRMEEPGIRTLVGVVAPCDGSAGTDSGPRV